MPRAIDSGDVNAYLRAVAGEGFSTKDIRTWNGTLLASRELARPGRDRPGGEDEPAAGGRRGRRRPQQHPRRLPPGAHPPRVLDAYLAGTLAASLRPGRGASASRLTEEEVALVGFLAGLGQGFRER